ncbi:MAG: AraC family transcriptional regulator [Sphingomonadaceae bacterium]|nr:AraC family transcriptional regulator [Sphingomonadaceae bacterium]
MQESQMADCDNVELSPMDAQVDSVAPDKIEVVQFAPPVELAPYVTQVYFFRCDERYIHDRQPAALGHLIFLLSGSGELKFQDGHVDPVSGATIFGPGLAAVEFRFDGPLYDLGFALSPLGFVALTGKPANQFADKAVAASTLFGPDIDIMMETFRDGYRRGDMRIADMVGQVSGFLLKRVGKVPPAHMKMIKTVIDWLSSDLDPDVDRLYPQLDMSRSTAARLITRYFGCAPKPLMRKYRALRAASLLVDPACTPELRAKIESLFYDQPHMIREVRQFAGRTPGALDGDDAKILRIWLSRDNYRDIETFPG